MSDGKYYLKLGSHHQFQLSEFEEMHQTLAAATHMSNTCEMACDNIKNIRFIEL